MNTRSEVACIHVLVVKSFVSCSPLQNPLPSSDKYDHITGETVPLALRYSFIVYFIGYSNIVSEFDRMCISITIPTCSVRNLSFQYQLC